MIQTALMPKVIFREYDIRGKVGDELKIDQVYDLGLALAFYIQQKKPQARTIVVGMDGRVHSPEIKHELVRALRESGFDIIFIGVCHSPALYFALHTQGYDAGVMITASHNPKEYNGLKICLGTTSVWGKAIQELYALYARNARVKIEHTGSYAERAILPAYIDWLVNHFPKLRNMQLSAVIDCGNGAGGSVIPDLVKAMNWQHVKVLFPEVDGSYPNHEADPVHAENMQDVKRVLETSDIMVGVGLDGDADRMAPMTKDGRLVSGDLLLGIFAQSASLPAESAVVCDVKSSFALLDRLKELRLQPVLSPSGHSIIKDIMKQHDAPLGGELSCHFFFHDRYFGYDDGVYAMLRLFETIQEVSLDTLLLVYPKMYTSDEYRIPCDENKKQLVVQTVKDIFAQKEHAECITIDGVRAAMPYGWGLIRASNTQPVLSMRFESTTAEGLVKIKKDFIHALAPFYDATYTEAALL
jgi:phosphomannomutase/phosphoglucomutase